MPERAVEFGIFSVAQAHAAGLTRTALRRGVRTGHLRFLDRGVLAVEGRGEHQHDRLVLALHRAGPRAALSHTTAAELFGWELCRGRARTHLTVPPDNSRVRGSGVVVHRAVVPTVVVSGVLLVVAPARTALDLAGTLPRVEAVVALDSALRSRLTTADDVAQELRDVRRWVRDVDAATALDLASPLSGSVPESLARLLWHDAGLPAPAEQLVLVLPGVGAVRVDFAWAGARLVVEIDGWAFHAGRDAFDRDRERDRALVLAGWRVLRFPAGLVRDDPDAVVAAVTAALAGGTHR